MKRTDVRNGTIIITAFCIVCTTLIFALRKSPEIIEATQAEAPYVCWSDTLTDRASDWRALEPMERDIQRFADKWNIRGLSLAVTRNDALVYAKGFGTADEDAATPMTSATLLRIASASKLVTAVAIMKLVEERRLGLDDKVFGPEGILNDTSFTAAAADRRIFDITVDHLLQHKGGFTLGAGDPMFNTADIIEAKRLDRAPTQDELVRIVLGRRLGFQPGSGRRYSNFGYMLLSKIIEKSTGQSYWDYVSESVLAPARAVRFKPGTTYLAERHPEETRYYGPDTVKVKEYNGSGRMVDRVYGGSDINGLTGAGGWVTTASDLARLVAAVDGRPGVKDIIPADAVALMTQMEEKEKQLRGWSESDGHGKLTRTGTLSSTHTLIQTFPDGECWVIITNTGVWTGHHFSHDLQRLVSALRAKYSADFPRRNLW